MVTFEEAFNPKPVKIPLNGKEFTVMPMPAIRLYELEEAWRKVFKTEGDEMGRIDKKGLKKALSVSFGTEVADADVEAITFPQILVIQETVMKVNGLAVGEERPFPSTPKE